MTVKYTINQEHPVTISQIQGCVGQTKAKRNRGVQLNLYTLVLICVPLFEMH